MKPSFWQRLLRAAQSPGSVGLAALGTGVLAAGVVNPLVALLAAPIYAVWGALLVGRSLRTPNLRGDAIKEIEGQLAQVAKLRFGAEHPREAAGADDPTAARIKERVDELLAEQGITRGKSETGPEARVFEGRLRQFRKIVDGEDAILSRLRRSPSGVAGLPPSLLADVSRLVTWAEAISRQRAEYLLILAQNPPEETLQRLEQKQRQIKRARPDERGDLEESLNLLEAEVERYRELQEEVRSIENQLDMIESLVRNLILSTPNVPSAREQIARVKGNIETYQQVNKDVRARLERSLTPGRTMNAQG